MPKLEPEAEMQQLENRPLPVSDADFAAARQKDPGL